MHLRLTSFNPSGQKIFIIVYHKFFRSVISWQKVLHRASIWSWLKTSTQLNFRNAMSNHFLAMDILWMPPKVVGKVVRKIAEWFEHGRKKEPFSVHSLQWDWKIYFKCLYCLIHCEFVPSWSRWINLISISCLNGVQKNTNS